MAHETKINKVAKSTVKKLNTPKKNGMTMGKKQNTQSGMPDIDMLRMSYGVATDYMSNIREEIVPRLEMFCPQILHTPDQSLGGIVSENDQYLSNKNPNFSAISTTFAKSAANVFNSDLLTGYGNAFELRVNKSLNIEDENRDDIAEQINAINDKVAEMIDNSNYEETRQLFIQQLVACGSTASMVRYIKDDLHFTVIPVTDLYITFPDDIGESQIHFPQTRKAKEWAWYYLSKKGSVPEKIQDLANEDAGGSKNMTLIHTQWPVWVKPNKENGLKKGVTMYYHIVWSKEFSMIIDINTTPSISKFFCFATMNATPKNPYGCGVAYEIENDIEILDQMTRQSLKALELASNPTYLLDGDKMKFDDATQIQPGDIVYTEGNPNAAVSAIQGTAYPQGMFAEVARREEKILARYVSSNEIFGKPGVTATAHQFMMAEFAKQRQMDSKAVGRVIRDEMDVALSVLFDNQVIPRIKDDEGNELIPMISNHTLTMSFKGFMSEMLMVENMRKYLALKENLPPQLQAQLLNYAQPIKDYIASGGDPEHFVKGWEDILDKTLEALSQVGAPQDITGLTDIQGRV